MSQGFSHSLGFLNDLVLAKLATKSIRVNNIDDVLMNISLMLDIT